MTSSLHGLRAAAAAVLSLLVAAVVAMSLTLSAAPASADTGGGADRASDTRAKRNYFGSISVSSDQAAGTSYNYRSKGAAKKRSLKECRRVSNRPGDCTWIITVRNGCAAVAIRTNAEGFVTDSAWGVARGRVAAKKEAKRKLGGGRVVASVCTAI